MDKKEYLIIKNLTCGYMGGFKLEPVNLVLKRGCFAGVIGCNGSGKSTLFKGLSGELNLSGGEILLDGISLSKLSLKERARRVALVPQFIEKSPITVEEYVLMGRMPYQRLFQFSESKEDIEITKESLEQTGIFHLRKKRVTEISGGEQQMTAIACALNQKPGLMLLDEPTSHLDIKFQSKIMNLLQRLNEEDRLTVIMIIHDLNLAGEYCDHLSLIKEGRIIKQGSPEEVLTYTNIELAYSSVVVESRNPVSGKPAIFQVSEKFSGRGIS